jgi:hypothetical protein
VLVAVQALPERQRDAILLRELEGRSYEEIALALGVSGGAVRQLLNRARNSLRSAAAALTPMPLLTRLASGDSTEPAAARVAEMVGMGAAGSGAVMAKLCATALVTGVVVGGVAVVPDSGRDDRHGPAVEAAEAAEDEDRETATPAPSGSGSDPLVQRAQGDGSGLADDSDRAALRGDDDSGHRERGEDGDRSGPGGGEEPEPDDDRSGPGGGEERLAEEPDDHSGPGGGGSGEVGDNIPEETARTDNSGPGGGGEPDSADAMETLEPTETNNSGPG